MIERCHLSRINRAVGTQAVPALPDGSCAHGHRIEPGGALLLDEKAKRGVVLADIAEGIRDQGRSDKAGRDVIVTVAHNLGEPPTSIVTLIVIAKQRELKRQGIGGYRIADNASAGSHVF